jgi:prepilin peptidase CpaA
MTDPTPVHLFVLALFAGLMGLAAVTDADRLSIPNRVVAALVLLYPVYVLASPQPVDWTGGLAVAAVTLIGGMLLWRLGTLGAGDVKLLAAAMLWAGPVGAPNLLLAMAVVGGALALVQATQLRFIAASLASLLFRDSGEAFLRAEVPYGIAIAVGAVVAVAPLAAAA